jgi:hypothetical protein
VLTAFGRVYSWGLNKHGQCCTGAAAEAGTGTAAAAAAAAGLATPCALSKTNTFEVERITRPKAVLLPQTISVFCVQQHGEHEAAEGTQTGPYSARKLVKYGKAVAVRAGRWHTTIELECG